MIDKYLVTVLFILFGFFCVAGYIGFYYSNKVATECRAIGGIAIQTKSGSYCISKNVVIQ